MSDDDNNPTVTKLTAAAILEDVLYDEMPTTGQISEACRDALEKCLRKHPAFEHTSFLEIDLFLADINDELEHALAPFFYEFRQDIVCNFKIGVDLQVEDDEAA